VKPKLHILVGQAWHFLRWELPHFKRHFTLVESPSDTAVLLGFGPDVLDTAAHLPALRRVAVLLPGFSRNPYRNPVHRAEGLTLIDTFYDLVFVNPGPLAEAYSASDKIALYPFSIDTNLARCRRVRTSLESLLHVSTDDPQKDWRRSEAVMQLTGLAYEIFPPRGGRVINPPLHRVKRRINHYCARLGRPPLFKMLPLNYMHHGMVVRKYQQHDGFVHVAAERPNSDYVDGKYTACLLEAGATGAILFWHDTLGLGNDLETVFGLPVEPEAAAREVLHIRASLDVETHSRRTRDEIRDTFDPGRSVALRCSRILELLDTASPCPR
jgi:hypothetical protein